MAKTIQIKIDDRKLNKQITNALKAAPKEAVKAMNDCVLDLAGESSRRAPVETGDLRNNCHATIQGVTVFESKKKVPAHVPVTAKLEGMVGYSLPYALRQHEDLSLRHSGPEHGNVDGGEAKFLEKPFEERKPRYIRRFEKVVEDSIK